MTFAIGGYEEITVDDTVKMLTRTLIRYGIVAATVIAEGGQLRFRLDGLDPTASVGILCNTNDVININGSDNLRDFKITKVSGSPRINVTYYYGQLKDDEHAFQYIPGTSNTASVTVTSMPGIVSADGGIETVGTKADAEYTTGDGTVISILKATFTKLSNKLGITVADGDNVAIGAKADAAYTTGDGTVISILKATFTKLSNKLGITVADGDNVAIGAKADAAYTTGDGTVISILKALFVKMSSVLTVNASLETSTVYDGTNAITPLKAFANIAASQTDAVIITGVTSKKIRVIAAYIKCGATATNITFNSKGAGAGTAISPLIANAINNGDVLPLNQVGWFDTNAGESLTVTTGTGSTTGIHIVYLTV